MGTEKDRRIVHLDMNAYFASVEQAANPALRGKPVAVGGGIGKRTVIATCSYEARALGVKTAMPTWEALKICPKLIIVPGDFEKYIYTSREIVNIMREYTDLLQVFSIDEAFLDITRTAERFGGEIALSKELKKRIKDRFNLTCSVGIGPNKLVAKVASDLQKPDGLTIITPEEVPLVFEFLPVEELCGIGRKLKKYLNLMGIMTCGDLARYPVQNLIERFGLVSGVHLSNMGKGIDDSPVDPSKDLENAKTISHSYTMPQNETDHRTIQSYLLNLSEQVGRRARKDGYEGRVVRVFVRLGDFSGYGQQKDLKEFIDDGYVIYKLAEKMISYEKPIRLIGVGLSNLRRNIDQVSLIETEKCRKSSLKAMDEINNRYGEFTIKRGSIMLNKLQKKTGMGPRIRYE